MGNKVGPARVSNIEAMSLPLSLERKIKKSVEDHKMMWEPWVESAENYSDFSKALRKRGFKGVPLSSSPLHRVVTTTESYKEISPVTKDFKDKETMLRKLKE